MGYYTDYKLTATDFADKDEEEKFESDLKTKCGYTGWDFSSTGTDFEMVLHEVKWYDHNDDMIALSKQYPHVLFELEGVGEEHGDMWRARYKNGESERVTARIVFDEFQKIL
jgi:hypothetical protein